MVFGWRKKSDKLKRIKKLRTESLEVRLAMSGTPLPIAGNWDGANGDSGGLYDRTLARFYLGNDNAPGFPDLTFTFGPTNTTAIAIAGDWNGDGADTVGTYDSTTGTFRIASANASAASSTTFVFGPVNAGFLPIAGDWDGDGDDSIGVYNPLTGQFLLRNSISAGAADITLVFGPTGPGMVAIAGDFDGDGDSTVGVYDSAASEFSITNDLNTAAVDAVFVLGTPGVDYTPLAGDWNNDGSDTVGLYEQDTQTFQLQDTLGPYADPTAFDYQYYLVPSTTTGPANVTTSTAVQLTQGEVQILLDRASGASRSTDAIIAVVDRGGNILGVRVEAGVAIADPDVLSFAIDGAVAKARTAAFFANNQAPLTSRTIQALSESTITQREMQSNPNVGDFDSSLQGPGFVAPVGLGGHFPAGIAKTPVVDLFAIEHTNRDSLLHPGLDGIKGTPDDIDLPNRFNVPDEFIAPGQGIFAPESFGFTTGDNPLLQARGIGTMPGGIPIFRSGQLIGGIGVFFPGTTGDASFEQNFKPGVKQTEKQRVNAPKALEAEYMAFAAVGGSAMAKARYGTIAGIPALPGGSPSLAGVDLPFGRIDLVGITLPLFGPTPGKLGIDAIVKLGKKLSSGATVSGTTVFLAGAAPGDTVGQAVPDGWLVLPHASGDLSVADIERIVNNGVDQAEDTRAAIRLQLTNKKTFIPGAPTAMVLSVADKDGNVLGLYRMPDATYFSIDVAVAKSRNTAYYADPTQIVAADRVDDNHDGIPDSSVPAGTALTNRTFRFLAEARYPSGVDGSRPGAFSIMNDPGFKTNLLFNQKVAINNMAAENAGAPLPASVYQSVLGFDSFHVGRNFHNPNNIANQNGVVFFPGSSALYETSVLVGGFGVSGDGVDQDDVVTAFGQVGFNAPSALRADQFTVRKVRLPYQKFNRNPEGGHPI